MLHTKRTSALAVAVACAVGLGGCSDYIERKDGISRLAGEANAHNKATQVIDPWPHASRNTRQGLDGARAGSAIERYRTNKVEKPEPLRPDGDE